MSRFVQLRDRLFGLRRFRLTKYPKDYYRLIFNSISSAQSNQWLDIRATR